MPGFAAVPSLLTPSALTPALLAPALLAPAPVSAVVPAQAAATALKAAAPDAQPAALNALYDNSRPLPSAAAVPPRVVDPTAPTRLPAISDASPVQGVPLRKFQAGIGASLPAVQLLRFLAERTGIPENNLKGAAYLRVASVRELRRRGTGLVTGYQYSVELIPTMGRGILLRFDATLSNPGLELTLAASAKESRTDGTAALLLPFISRDSKVVGRDRRMYEVLTIIARPAAELVAYLSRRSGIPESRLKEEAEQRLVSMRPLYRRGTGEVRAYEYRVQLVSTDGRKTLLSFKATFDSGNYAMTLTP